MPVCVYCRMVEKSGDREQALTRGQAASGLALRLGPLLAFRAGCPSCADGL